MACADRGALFCELWTNPVHNTEVEAGAELDGHGLFVKILPR
jgi:hypothetical protein